MNTIIPSKITKRAGLPLAAVGIAALSFYGGAAYQTHTDNRKLSTMTASVRQAMPAGGQFGSFRRLGLRVAGQVTSSTSTSLTLQTNSGQAKTVNITSSTVITDGGQAAGASDIKTGDTVLVTLASSTSSDASRIMLNPSFGGFGGSQMSAPPSGLQSN